MKFPENSSKVQDYSKWYTKANSWFSSLVGSGLSYGASFYVGKVTQEVSKKAILQALPENPAAELLAETGSSVAAITTVALYDGLQTGLREQRVGNLFAFSLNATITTGGLILLNEVSKHNIWVMPVITAVTIAGGLLEYFKHEAESKIVSLSKSKEIEHLKLANIVSIQDRERKASFPQGNFSLTISNSPSPSSQQKEGLKKIISEKMASKKVQAAVNSSAPIVSSLCTMLNSGKGFNFATITQAMVTAGVSFVYRIKKEKKIKLYGQNKGAKISSKLKLLSDVLSKEGFEKVLSEAKDIVKTTSHQYQKHRIRHNAVKVGLPKKMLKKFSHGHR